MVENTSMSFYSSPMNLSPTEIETAASGENHPAFSKAFCRLMEHWSVTNEEMAQLLGWSYKIHRTRIDNLYKGHSLPFDRDKFERVRDLLNIHKSLRILFPNQRDLVYHWVKVPRERFGGYSALDIMLTDGKSGISAIRRYLDHERTR
jgi:hypothetical protein